MTTHTANPYLNPRLLFAHDSIILDLIDISRAQRGVVCRVNSCRLLNRTKTRVKVNDIFIVVFAAAFL